MNELAQWLIELPKHFAEFGGWLTTPIQIGSFSATPLAMFGASAGAFVGVLVILKIKSLVIV